MARDTRTTLWYGALWTVAVLTALALGGANLLFGELNQDEGWYLYAARLVSHGKLPYADFASTQGPVMPFVYALGQPLVDRLGLAGGRLITGTLGLASAFCAAWLASLLAAPRARAAAALMAFCLAGVNVYQSYFCTIVKTYALTSLWLTLGFVALAEAWRSGGRTAAAAAGALLVLAAGTRTSAAAAIPVTFAWLAGARRMRAGGLWFWFAAGAAAAACVVFLPFLVKAPRGLWFALYEYHAGRMPGSALALAAYKGGFVSRVAQAYFVAAAAGLVLAFRRLFGASAPEEREGRSAALSPLWLSVLGVTALHAAAPFPYDDYQAIVYPLFAAGLGAVLAGRAAAADGSAGQDAASAPRRLWIPVSLLAACVAAAFSSPINQSWFVSGRDRVWWPLRGETPLGSLRKAAGAVKAAAGGDRMLLTQDLYLAVEAGMDVPAGLELGPFSYFPDWPAEKARACRVLNGEMLEEVLRDAPAGVAAFSGYGLAIRSPSVTELSAGEQRELWRLVERRYRPVCEIPRFGQGETTLRVLRRI